MFYVCGAVYSDKFSSYNFRDRHFCVASGSNYVVASRPRPPAPYASCRISERLLHGGRFLGQRDVTIGDLLDEAKVRVVQHDMEVLDGVHRLEAFPVLEPDDLVPR